MNTTKIAKGWALIAEGAMELSLAYEAIDSEASGSVSPVDDMPPLEEPPSDSGGYQPKGVNLRDEHVANVLGQCPTHQRNWTVREAGVSKSGKSYNAFWRCAEKDDMARNGWCEKRPVKAWADANPIGAAAA